jgi:hypothetical protein
MPLNAHVNNFNNPHGLTKQDVGLGLVQNYPLASIAEAEGLTANNRYLTPQTGRLAIIKALKNLGYLYANGDPVTK